ncbi:MAG: hypothetical protein NZ602_00450 [Thermoguttaceae bacterium]|nr:hypothetical protein [Thermoguttaceae bacterium]MDW8037035.1 hypothetical protein [Thermoguttaceae bacterium]
MEVVKRLRFFYLAYLSYPAKDRVVYRLVRRHPSRNILEIGLGRGIRAQRLLQLLCEQLPADQLLYTGIDLFEARPPQFGPILPLKQVYQNLRTTGARIRLYPGDPYSVLSHRANQLGPVDLLLIASPIDPKSMAKAWYYIPRLLHPDSLVLVEQPIGQKGRFRKLTPSSLEAWAEARRIPQAA